MVKSNGRMVNGLKSTILVGQSQSVIVQVCKELEDEKENGDDKGRVEHFAGEEIWRGHHESLIWVK